MTLEETVLRKLAEWRPNGAARETLNVRDERTGCSAQVTADRCDALGVRAWELSLRRVPVLDLDQSQLRDWAASAVKRVRGLSEPLVLVEVDAGRRLAQARSKEPAGRGDQVSYFEALFHGDGQVVFRRYQAGRSGGRRTQAAFTLTHDVLARLAHDLTA